MSVLLRLIRQGQNLDQNPPEGRYCRPGLLIQSHTRHPVQEINRGALFSISSQILSYTSCQHDISTTTTTTVTQK